VPRPLHVPTIDAAGAALAAVIMPSVKARDTAGNKPTDDSLLICPAGPTGTQVSESITFPRQLSERLLRQTREQPGNSLLRNAKKSHTIVTSDDVGTS